MTVLLVPFMMIFCSSICSGSLLYALDRRARWSVIACAQSREHLVTSESTRKQRPIGLDDWGARPAARLHSLLRCETGSSIYAWHALPVNAIVVEPCSGQ